MSFKQRVALMSALCRVCGQEEKSCISVFSEIGKKQEIEKKIRLCLPLVIEEGDMLPKQICLKCLNKLDASWELVQLCKSGQTVIERKLNYISENNIREQVYINNPNMIEDKIKSLSEDRPITIGDSAVITLVPVAEQDPLQVDPLQGDPAPVTIPPVTSEAVMGIVPSYQVPVPTTNVTPTAVPPTPAADNTVYPQGLIQVLPSSKPVLYQQQNNVVKPSPPAPAARRNITQSSRRRMQPVKSEITPPKSNITPKRSLPPTTTKRALNGESSASVRTPKKVLLQCTYCKKSFPDEIIDHHVSLHLRQSFFTCIDCNKNFRSEMAMSRHRCGTTESSPIDAPIDAHIDLDAEDEPICV